jgi:phenylacetate-coenzyme A ligase PaaK-like adenylate-forming protein
MSDQNLELLWGAKIEDIKKRQREVFAQLTNLHQSHSSLYRKLIKFQTKDFYVNLSDFPMLPISIFKDFDLMSVDETEIFKILTSSGTTGQRPSKIFLDKTTAQEQVRVLSKTVSHSIGPNRLPMLILDSPSVLKNRNHFSARGAGILGFSIFASKKYYALDENMNINIEEIKRFYLENRNSSLLLYGFTYIIWSQIVEKLIEHNLKFQGEEVFVIHGGGWKKLVDSAVDRKQFNQALSNFLGATKVINYYGMAEQTGSIFMECSNGLLHTTPYNSIIVRDFKTLGVSPIGKFGYLQTFSTIPTSYAGHSLLTEDVGRVIFAGDCPCGESGFAFEIIGRVKQAEVRGCSDTFEN